MDRIKDALLRMFRAYRKAMEINEALEKHGYNDTPYSYIAGEIADAIYGIVGEEAPTWEDSVTYAALNAPKLCDERRASMLLYEYRLNNCPGYEPKQPRPNTIEPEEMRKMHKKNGGYIAPEGDWTP